MGAMTELDGRLFGEDHTCFGCGPKHPFGFRLAFERHEDEVHARFTPGEHYQGPPGLMHGGLTATLADEVGAWAIIVLLGKFGFTGSMQCRLRRPIRIGEELLARARIEDNRGRVVKVAVAIEQGGAEAFTGDLTFVLLDEARAKEMVGDLPPAWKRFARD